MTSGNLSSNPLIYQDDQAFQSLTILLIILLCIIEKFLTDVMTQSSG